MAYRTDGTLAYGQWTKARYKAAAIAADGTTYTDANFPAVLGPHASDGTGAIDCTGFETILLKVSITAGSSPTMTLEALFRDADAADGSRWVRRVNGSGAITTPALAPDLQEAELYVDGCPIVFPRITAVANSGSTTAWAIYVRPGKRSRARPPGGR